MEISKAKISTELVSAISASLSALGLHGRVVVFNSEDKGCYKSMKVIIDFDKPSSDKITEPEYVPPVTL